MSRAFNFGEEKTTEELRNELSARYASVEGVSGRRSYTAADINSYEPNYSKSNRDDVSEKAAKAIKTHLERRMGKGGMMITEEDFKIKASHEDRVNPNNTVIDRAIVAFKVDFMTEKEPVSVYAAVNYNSDDESFDVMDNVVDVASEKRVSVNKIESFLKDSTATKLNPTKLVLYNIADNNNVHYENLNIKEASLVDAKSALQANGFEVRSVNLSKCDGMTGPAYEVIALPSQYPTMKKVISQWENRSLEQGSKGYPENKFEDRSLEKGKKEFKDMPFEDRSAEKTAVKTAMKKDAIDPTGSADPYAVKPEKKSWENRSEQKMSQPEYKEEKFEDRTLEKSSDKISNYEKKDFEDRSLEKASPSNYKEDVMLRFEGKLYSEFKNTSQTDLMAIHEKITGTKSVFAFKKASTDLELVLKPIKEGTYEVVRAVNIPKTVNVSRGDILNFRDASAIGELINSDQIDEFKKFSFWNEKLPNIDNKDKNKPETGMSGKDGYTSPKAQTPGFKSEDKLKLDKAEKGGEFKLDQKFYNQKKAQLSLNPQEVEKMSLSPDKNIRMKLAQDVATPVSVLVKLASDPEMEVSGAAKGNPNYPTTYKQETVTPGVTAVKATMANPELLKHLTPGKSGTPKVRRMFASKIDKDFIQKRRAIISDFNSKKISIIEAKKRMATLKSEFAQNKKNPNPNMPVEDTSQDVGQPKENMPEEDTSQHVGQPAKNVKAFDKMTDQEKFAMYVAYRKADWANQTTEDTSQDVGQPKENQPTEDTTQDVGQPKENMPVEDTSQHVGQPGGKTASKEVLKKKITKAEFENEVAKTFQKGDEIVLFNDWVNPNDPKDTIKQGTKGKISAYPYALFNGREVKVDSSLIRDPSDFDGMRYDREFEAEVDISSPVKRAQLDSESAIISKKQRDINTQRLLQRTKHVGHPYKGNSINVSVGDYPQGNGPTHAMPLSPARVAEDLVHDSWKRYNLDVKSAFKGFLGSDRAKNISPEQIDEISTILPAWGYDVSL